MPAYRAERTLGPTVADIPHGVAEELILVDDASPDRTVERARDLGIRVFVHSRNRGYGGNQKSCYSIALEQGADVVVLLHPDYQYDPKAVPLLVAPILAGDADMTFGSRFAGLGDPRSGGMPLYRFIGNRVTTLLENLMLKARFTEMHSGMRAYTRQSLLGLPFRSYSDDYVFDSQLLVDAVLSGQRVVEVPIPTRYTEESSSISVLRSLNYVSASLLYCARETWRKGQRGSRWPPAISTLRQGRRLEQGQPLAAPCPLCHENILFSISRSFVQCPKCGLVSAQHDPHVVGQPQATSVKALSAVLDAMRRFWLPGRQLTILGRDAERLALAAGNRGWKARCEDDLRSLQGQHHAILLADLIADLTDPVAALRIVGDALSPDGLLALTCSQMISPGRTDPRASASRLHHFSTETLHAALSQGGFRSVDWVPWIRSSVRRRGDAESLDLVVSRKAQAAS
jgi:hypothetical protein